MTDLEKRLKFIEFRQELLFRDDPVSRLFFEYKITEEQVDQFYDLFDDYQTRIENKMDVHHGSFEQALYEIVPEQNGNYHFVEFLAKELFDSGRWQEVFEKLYGDMLKYQQLFKK